MRFSCRFLWYRFLPFMVCLVLILLNAIPFHWLPNFPYSFQWVLLPIFYFAVYYPKLLSGWAVFILSLIADMINSGPLGIIPFTYMSVFFISNFLRKYLMEMTFGKLWITFVGIASFVELLSCFFVWLLAKHMVSYSPVAIELIGLILAYPFFIRFCAHLDRKARENS